MSRILDIKDCIHYYAPMNSSQNPTVRANRKYAIQFSIAMVAYVVVLVSVLEAIQHFHMTGNGRFVLLLLPLIPVIAIVPAVLSYYRDTDEFEQRITVQSLAIAAGVTAVCSVTYGFLELAGLPKLSAWYTWLVVMGSWFIARLALRWRYR